MSLVAVTTLIDILDLVVKSIAAHGILLTCMLLLLLFIFFVSSMLHASLYVSVCVSVCSVSVAMFDILHKITAFAYW